MGRSSPVVPFAPFAFQIVWAAFGVLQRVRWQRFMASQSRPQVGGETAVPSDDVVVQTFAWTSASLMRGDVGLYVVLLVTLIAGVISVALGWTLLYLPLLYLFVLVVWALWPTVVQHRRLGDGALLFTQGGLLVRSREPFFIAWHEVKGAEIYRVGWLRHCYLLVGLASPAETYARIALSSSRRRRDFEGIAMRGIDTVPMALHNFVLPASLIAPLIQHELDARGLVAFASAE